MVVPGAAHHVTQRGNNRQDVFLSGEDRRVYLGILRKQALSFQFRVLGYCLMTNHVHVVGIPENELSLSMAIGRTHFLYALHVNRQQGRSGHVWQNRFFSCPMDDAHTLAALCYAELNPVRAGIIEKPWKYDWSSAAAHCGRDEPDPVLDMNAWNDIAPDGEWVETLRAFMRDTTTIESLRRSTQCGRPLGDNTFIGMVDKRRGVSEGM
ncbi:MAG: transposase [Candidatus Hydrogenedens sp.]|nr:transposase [Candidatus Hydrogenedentota bacterium]NLF56299.1 transposase [Candidatus Hydrogenedens sp.]